MRGISSLALLIIALAMFNFGCSSGPVAGGVSEEANALLINGNVTDTNGVSLDSAIVTVIPDDYIPSEHDPLPDSFTVYTDSNGYFEIIVNDSDDNYNVYAEFGDRSAIIWGQKSPDTSLISLTLNKNGALRIVLPDTLDTVDGEIYIEGFPKVLVLNSAKVDSKAGYAVLFNSLPICTIEEIYYRDELGSIVLDTSVEITLGDTLTILSENEIVIDTLDYAHLNINNSDIPTNFVYHSIAGDSGESWYGTQVGLLHYTDAGWAKYNSSNTIMEADVVNYLFIDDLGVVWGGLAGGGLVSFDGSNWKSWTEDDSDLPSDNITEIVSEPGRGLWLTTDGGGLVLFDGTNFTIFDNSNSLLPSDNLISIDIVGKTKWIAATGGAIIKMDSLDNMTIYDENDEQILSNSLFCIRIEETTGDIWVGTQQGLLRFDHSSWESFTFNDWGNTENRVASIAFDSDGTKWVGTYSGLLSYNGSDWTDYSTYKNGELGSHIENIAMDASGNKWCSLFNNGVVVFNTLQ